jgi:hypothetical protein
MSLKQNNLLQLLQKCADVRKTTKKVTYTFVDSYHSLCLDKRVIIFEELNACERLLKYSHDYNIDDEIEKKAIESEIAYLKMILDLMP